MATPAATATLNITIANLPEQPSTPFLQMLGSGLDNEHTTKRKQASQHQPSEFDTCGAELDPASRLCELVATSYRR